MEGICFLSTDFILHPGISTLRIVHILDPHAPRGLVPSFERLSDFEFGDQIFVFYGSQLVHQIPLKDSSKSIFLFSPPKFTEMIFVVTNLEGELLEHSDPKVMDSTHCISVEHDICNMFDHIVSEDLKVSVEPYYHHKDLRINFSFSAPAQRSFCSLFFCVS